MRSSTLFSPEEKQYQHFIHAFLNSTARLDAKQNRGEEGLCTTDLVSCLGYIIIDDKARKMSLSHYSAGTSLKLIYDEYKRHGDESRIVIVYNSDIYKFARAKGFTVPENPPPADEVAKGAQLMLRQLLPKVDISLFAAPNGCVAVARNGKITAAKSQEIGLRHENADLWELVQSATLMLRVRQQQSVYVVYENGRWVCPPCLEKEVWECIRNIKSKLKSGAFTEEDIFNVLRTNINLLPEQSIARKEKVDVIRDLESIARYVFNILRFEKEYKYEIVLSHDIDERDWEVLKPLDEGAVTFIAAHAKALADKARNLFIEKDNEKALEIYRACVRLYKFIYGNEPKKAVAYTLFNAGCAALEANKLELAEQYLQSALQTQTKLPNDDKFVGMISLRLGQLKLKRQPATP